MNKKKFDKIMPNNLHRQFNLHKDEYEKKAIEVLNSGWYILGKEVESFEKEWANYIGTKYCVGLASGLDALWIAFRILGIKENDEVIVCSNDFSGKSGTMKCRFIGKLSDDNSFVIASDIDFKQLSEILFIDISCKSVPFVFNGILNPLLATRLIESTLSK